MNDTCCVFPFFLSYAAHGIAYYRIRRLILWCTLRLPTCDSQEATKRVLLFTVCKPGAAGHTKPEHGAAGDVRLLCDTWWANHANKWAQRVGIAVAMITDTPEDGRSLHWAKLTFSSAFLTGFVPKFDYIVFTDSDSVVRRGA